MDPLRDKRDALNFRDYPPCTLFSLVDLLQEFGRLIQVAVPGQGIHYVVPMTGIRLSDYPARLGRFPNTPALEEAQDRLWRGGLSPFEPCEMDDLTKAPPEGLYLSFVTHGDADLLTSLARDWRHVEGWREDMVGAGVGDWLRDAGLDCFVRVDGHADAASSLERRFRDAKASGQERPRNIRRVWGTNRAWSYLIEWAIGAQDASIRGPANKRLTRIAPVAVHDPTMVVRSLAARTLYRSSRVLL